MGDRLARPPLPSDRQPQYTTADEDAHLQTLCRMAENEPIVLSPASTGTTEPVRPVFEYYSDLNSLSLLNEAIGRPNRRWLVRVDLEGPKAGSVLERELRGLDDIDQTYLGQRRVHDYPSEEAW
jgi:hypothetical protein